MGGCGIGRTESVHQDRGWGCGNDRMMSRMKIFDVDIVLRKGLWYYTRHLLGIDVADATIEKQASGLALRQD